eukprot:1142831-Pelagomonas_calceolata.AAC.4
MVLPSCQVWHQGHQAHTKAPCSLSAEVGLTKVWSVTPRVLGTYQGTEYFVCTMHFVRRSWSYQVAKCGTNDTKGIKHVPRHHILCLQKLVLPTCQV